MTLITVRHNQRENKVPLSRIEQLRYSDPRDKTKGVVILVSGRELLCSDMPYVESQICAVQAEAPRSLFDAIFGSPR